MMRFIIIITSLFTFSCYANELRSERPRDTNAGFTHPYMYVNPSFYDYYAPFYGTENPQYYLYYESDNMHYYNETPSNYDNSVDYSNSKMDDNTTLEDE